MAAAKWRIVLHSSLLRIFPSPQEIVGEKAKGILAIPISTSCLRRARNVNFQPSHRARREVAWRTYHKSRASEQFPRSFPRSQVQLGNEGWRGVERGSVLRKQDVPPLIFFPFYKSRRAPPPSFLLNQRRHPFGRAALYNRNDRPLFFLRLDKARGFAISTRAIFWSKPLN